MELRINQQYAKIGLRISEPRLQLKSTQPKMQMHTQKPKLEMESPRPQIQIDQHQCFADANMRNPEDFRHYCLQKAQADYAQALDKIVSDGNRMASIDKGVTVEDMAADAMSEEYDFNMGFMPEHRPQINYQAQAVKFNFHRGTVDLQLQRGRVENTTQMGKVEAYIAQKNFLEINWLESKHNYLA